MDDAFLIGQSQHFVLVVCEIQIDVVLEIFSDFIKPGKCQFNAPVFYVSSVNIGSACAIG